MSKNFDNTKLALDVLNLMLMAMFVPFFPSLTSTWSFRGEDNWEVFCRHSSLDFQQEYQQNPPGYYCYKQETFLGPSLVDFDSQSRCKSNLKSGPTVLQVLLISQFFSYY